MMPISMSSRTRAILSVMLIAVVFLALRLPGIDLPSHQDEWKNISASSSIEGAGKFFAHPPLMQMMFVAGYKVFGPDYLRVLPFLFAIGTYVLLYFVVKRRLDRKAALWAVGLSILCFYSVFASLQLDVDGSMLPFFFLLAVFAYDRLPGKKWAILLVVALMLGLLVKLNFILAVGAIILDYLWNNRRNQIGKKIGFSILHFVVFVGAYIGLLYLIQAIYPAFSIKFMIEHANQFSEDVGRNWIQIAVQGVKSIYYLSPLMLVPLLWFTRENLRKTLVFVLYFVLGLIFYFVLFDFSRGALDKYLMFMIVPLSVMVGAVLSTLKFEKGSVIKFAGTGAVVGIIFLLANFLPHEAVPLYPKTEWFSRVLKGEWNVLTPLHGGSGPLGFYVSFLFIALSYIASILAGVAALFKKAWRPGAAIIIVVIGIIYNLVFAQELLFGGINGSAKQVLRETTEYIANSAEIKQVLTYNDTGAGTLSRMGKYAGRIYATPDSEEGYRKKFSEFDGHHLVVNVPRLYESGFYYKFFEKCETLFETKSKMIYGKVYDCSKAKAVINTI